jgi:hypothetical protein
MKEDGANEVSITDGGMFKVSEDPDDPPGPEKASPGFINNLLKTFPGVPQDIFPGATK